MEYGKQVCSHLKEIRRQIAKDNDIALDIPECTYQGECSGTCPRCEMELQILEKELTRRSLLGKAAMIAGVTVSLATCQNAMAQELWFSCHSCQAVGTLYHIRYNLFFSQL